LHTSLEKKEKYQRLSREMKDKGEIHGAKKSRPKITSRCIQGKSGVVNMVVG